MTDWKIIFLSWFFRWDCSLYRYGCYQSNFLFSTLMLIEPLFAWDAAIGYFGHDTNFVVVCVFLYTIPPFCFMSLFLLDTVLFSSSVVIAGTTQQASNLVFYTQSTSLLPLKSDCFSWSAFVAFFFFCIYIFFNKAFTDSFPAFRAWGFLWLLWLMSG